ncbi:uncharacterized protein [Ptychodera flava]|uniref:uncharacterized protein n=1 Tax=Ptychodera flava TaxID=63121 RepID=UPI00396A723C
MTIAEYNENMSTQHFRMNQPRFCDKPIKSDVRRKDGDRVEPITHNQLLVQREERRTTKQTGNNGLKVIGGRELGDKKKQTQPEPLVVRAKHRQPTKEVLVTKRETKATETKQSNLRPCVMKGPSDGWSKFKLEGQGPSPGQKFNDPCGLTFHNDKLLVCDKGNNVVQILNKEYTCEKVLGSFSRLLVKPFQPVSVAVSQDNNYNILDDNNCKLLLQSK